MASHILEPIDQYHDKNAWIFQYDDTAHVESGNGETFNQVSYFENAYHTLTKSLSVIINKELFQRS